MSSVAYIESSMCDRSPMCAAKRACPQKAISQSGSGKGLLSFLGGGILAVDTEKCTGCKVCINRCPHGAIKMVDKG